MKEVGDGVKKVSEPSFSEKKEMVHDKFMDYVDNDPALQAALNLRIERRQVLIDAESPDEERLRIERDRIIKQYPQYENCVHDLFDLEMQRVYSKKRLDGTYKKTGQVREPKVVFDEIYKEIQLGNLQAKIAHGFE